MKEYKQAIKELQQAGYCLKRQTGGHDIYHNDTLHKSIPLKRHEGGKWFSCIPDLQNDYMTSAKSFEELCYNTQDALQGVLQVMQAAGEPLPQPTPFLEVKHTKQQLLHFVTVDALKAKIA